MRGVAWGLFGVVALGVWWVGRPGAADPGYFNGTLRGDVLAVVDEGTLEMRVRPWPGVSVRTLVEVRGLPCPARRLGDAVALAGDGRLPVGDARLWLVTGTDRAGRVRAHVVLPVVGEVGCGG